MGDQQQRGARRGGGGVPTQEEMEQDAFGKLAAKHWYGPEDKRAAYSAEIIDSIYGELKKGGFPHRRITILEYTHFLENYLWPHYAAGSASVAHHLLIVLMVNEKFREQHSAWPAFQAQPDEFPAFVQRIMAMLVEEDPAAENMTMREHTSLVVFFIHCFASLENELVRSQMQPLTGLATWKCIQPERRAEAFKGYPKLRKGWKVLQKKQAKLDEAAAAVADQQATFLWKTIQRFLRVLRPLGRTEQPKKAKLEFCERMLELLIDLESCLPTRRFFNLLLDSTHVVVRCDMSPLPSMPEGSLFGQLLDILRFYAGFEINDFSGLALTDADMTEGHYARLLKIQRIAFQEFKSLRSFALSNVSAIDTRPALEKHFADLSSGELHKLAHELALLPAPETDEGEPELDGEPEQAEMEEDEEKPALVFSHIDLEAEKATLTNTTDTDLGLEGFYVQDIIGGNRSAPFGSSIVIPAGASVTLWTCPAGKQHSAPVSDDDAENILWRNKDGTPRAKPVLNDAEDGLAVFDPEGTMVSSAKGAEFLEAEAKPVVSRRPREFLVRLLVAHHQRRLSQIDALNEMPLYPDEQILWDENVVPSEFYTDGALALPKLNLQFLTLHDYLLRNLNLFRLESTYEIRNDLEETVPRLRAHRAEDGSTQFAGWARMAQQITDFGIVAVGQPKIAQTKPSFVRADVRVDLNVNDRIRREWEGLRKHDVGFLVAVQAPVFYNEAERADANFPQLHGIVAVRGCEIEGMLDHRGHIIEDFPDEPPMFRDNQRTFRVWLDPNQYQSDMAAIQEGGDDVYQMFNVFVRRNPKENNFKQVLETIRELMNTQCVVPDWLVDVFLGYGDPAAANYKQLKSQEATQDYRDTFLSMEHLKASFPGYDITCSESDPAKQVAPLRLTFAGVSKKRKHDQLVPRSVGGAAAAGGEGEGDEAPKQIVATPYVEPNRGPYPRNQPKQNAVPFTPTQVEAIRSGMQKGLTLIVGPPGTGKTDVAVQMISNLYHNYKDERTLIVTHSNQALNQLFEKIMALDIDPRHLLRLGRGEEDLATDERFSRFGRVDFILAQRLELLREVERLAAGLPGVGEMSYTCETAVLFFEHTVRPLWKQFEAKLASDDTQAVSNNFPFWTFFADAPQPLFKGSNFEADLEVARGCWRHLSGIFERLNEYRAFELLNRSRDRSKYLLVKEAKIIAMTCTHAALTRSDLVACGFKYDNIVMEEAAQILEVETFIPLMLQNPEDGFSRLKRICLIGDHHQLPPVIKNQAFKKFSNMEQSMFTRFVRLGVPYIELDAQGRMRPSLCDLYRWRYDNLGDLPHTQTLEAYKAGNAGFRHEYQFVEVDDFNGVGETCPEVHFFQNLAEAEFVVATFMYMRLLGYPADSITMLTTYNGQKALLRDIVETRCGSNPLFGRPAQIETVDKYQGSQNNFILLSLVRTKHVGHLRDIRRLVVALSRARLGLYIFGRASLYKGCFELAPAFSKLLQRPTKLELYPSETFPTERSVSDQAADPLVIADMPHMTQYVYELTLERARSVQASQQQAVQAQRDEMVAQAPPNTLVRVEHIDLTAEKVFFRNISDDPFNLDGCYAGDVVGGNTSKPFRRFVVPPGARFALWTSPGGDHAPPAGVKESGANLFWRNKDDSLRKQPVLNDTADGIRLFSSNGHIIAHALAQDFAGGLAQRASQAKAAAAAPAAAAAQPAPMDEGEEKGVEKEEKEKEEEEEVQQEKMQEEEEAKEAGARAAAAGDLVFEDIRLEGERATVRNASDASVSLAGCVVYDLSGGNHSKPLPELVIESGAVFTLWTAPGGKHGPGDGVEEDAANVFWRNQNGKPRSQSVLNDEQDGLKIVGADKSTVIAEAAGAQFAQQAQAMEEEAKGKSKAKEAAAEKKEEKKAAAAKAEGEVDEAEPPAKRSRKTSRSRTRSTAESSEADTDHGGGSQASLPGNLAKMKVAELREELKARGLPTTGRKKELLDRLKESEGK